MCDSKGDQSTQVHKERKTVVCIYIYISIYIYMYILCIYIYIHTKPRYPQTKQTNHVPLQAKFLSNHKAPRFGRLLRLHLEPLAAALQFASQPCGLDVVLRAAGVPEAQARGQRPDCASKTIVILMVHTSA